VEQETCTYCDGEGVHVYKNPDADYGTDEYPCTECNGTGYVGGEPDNSDAISRAERSWDSYMYGE
jgi:DnaJ-class molecular chaperone